MMTNTKDTLGALINGLKQERDALKLIGEEINDGFQRIRKALSDPSEIVHGVEPPGCALFAVAVC